MNDTIKRLALTEDYSVLHAADTVITEILHNNPYSTDELSNALTTESEVKEQLSEVITLATETPTETLNDLASIRFARQLLVHLALAHPTAAAHVNNALKNWTDDRQNVSKVFAYGVAASMIYLIAATEVRYSDGEIHIEKKAIDAEQIQAIADLISTVKKDETVTRTDMSKQVPQSDKR